MFLKAIGELSFPKTKKGVQAFLGALNYYSRFIQDFAVYGAALYQVREEDFGPGGDLSTAKRSFTALQAKVTDAPILRHFDRAKAVHVMLFANDWALSTTLMQEHDGVMHPVRFCGHVLKDNEVNYHPAEKEVLALLLLLMTCYTQLAGRAINAYTRFSTLRWINTFKTLLGRSTQFAVMLSPWHLVVHRVTEDDSAFAQLHHSTITNFVGLDKALQRVAPPSKRTPMVRMDPELLYARLPNDHRGFVLSFDGSAKTPKHGGYGSCAWILWRLPDSKIEIAASAYLENTTVNQAEYMGMNEGLRAAQAYGATDLVVVGDSRLAIQQSLGVIACLKESLLSQPNIHRELVARFQSVRYLHVAREYNASADSLAGETLATKEAKTTLTEESKSKLEQLNRIHEVIYVRPNREVTQVTVATNPTATTAAQAAAANPTVAANDKPALPAAPTANVGGPEPDDEPRPAEAGVSGDVTNDAGGEKRTAKIDLKNVKMTSLSGVVPPGAYDSGGREWWEQFADQLEDAQVHAGQEWSSTVKKSALSIILTGSARRWLQTFRAEHPLASFEETGNALVAKFRPNLMDQEITARIYSEGIRAAETYQEYADRLLQMADGLTGGSDGRLDDYKRRKVADGSRGTLVKTKFKPADVKGKTASGPKSKSLTLKAHSAVVERKRKPTRMPPRNSIVCYICNEEGHTAKFHRQHLSKTTAEPDEAEAQGNAATAENEDSASEDSVDESA
ncbi:unnamed protein product [Phytophthora fragariaefolia]|uniref:Unnamed protein product n=1 Tax=Phytophthora fragariaefolia TaxID=1490495 RepID=A0A9W6WWM5_9STRA|nr:unnamed protein product [Phytophthora fragariaefolia]